MVNRYKREGWRQMSVVCLGLPAFQILRLKVASQGLLHPLHAAAPTDPETPDPRSAQWMTDAQSKKTTEGRLQDVDSTT